MAKISDTSSYPSITPAAGDYLVLTDVSDSNSTKTVTMQSIADFIGGGGATFQGGDGIDVDFGTTPSTISADLKTDGGIVFESSELAVDLGASSITGTLAISDGGTGQTTRQAAIDSLTLASTSDPGYVLTSDGTNANFSQISVGDVSGTLAVANGGTGKTTLTSGGILKGNGTSAITADGDINDLASAQYTTTSDGSLYLGNIPSSLSGSPLGNTVIGNDAGDLLTTGVSNVCIGNSSGNTLTTGTTNVIIGKNADTSASGTRGGVAIGEGATVGEEGIAIGKSAVAGDSELAIGDINLDITSKSASSFLPIKIYNGTTMVQYYIQLYVA